VISLVSSPAVDRLDKAPSQALASCAIRASRWQMLMLCLVYHRRTV